jgi:uncharacterized membrane protein YhfC
LDLTFFMHLLNGLWMLALPLGLAAFLARRFHYSWRLVGMGALTFVLSQVGHIPFNSLALNPLLKALGASLPPGLSLLANALLLGLSAGLFEEGSRYLVLWRWAKNARSWRSALVFGVGHGGVEAVILGGLTLATFVYMAAYRSVDLATIVPANQVALAKQQVAAYWGVPWYAALLGALERTLTIPCHLAMSVLVMQAFTRGKRYWLWLAVLFHTLLDATAVYLMGIWGNQSWGVYAIEGGVAVFTLASLAIIFLLRQPEPPAPAPAPPLPPIEPMLPAELPVSEENLDNSRFVS